MLFMDYDAGGMREAAESMRSLAGRDSEAAAIARDLEGGRLPESISDRLFGELMEFASAPRLAMWVGGGKTAREARAAGYDAGEIESAGNAVIRAAVAFRDLVRAGFAPSPGQRDAVVSRLSELVADEKPFDFEKPHLSHGRELAVSICHDTLKGIAHLLDRGQCEQALAGCRGAKLKQGFIGAWMENAVPQSDISALMERELTAMLRGGGDGVAPSERIEAFRMRQRLEAMGKGHGLPVREGGGRSGPEPRKIG
jgi:hypothetical protein